MISRTFRISIPYSSLPKAKVRYFPPLLWAALPTGVAVDVLIAVPLSAEWEWGEVWSFPRGQVDQTWDIEDQADVSVTEDRAAADAADVADAVTQRFDDDLLLTEQLIDQQAAAAVVIGDDHHQRLGRVLGDRLDIEQLVQAIKGKQVASDHAHLAASLHGRELLGLGAE